MSIGVDTARTCASAIWRDEILPTLVEYLRIPNVSPAYCPTWETDGDMSRAVQLFESWAKSRPLPGSIVEVLQLPGRTPLVVVDVPPHGGPTDDDAVVLYGHLDKQPPMDGWREGLGAFTPVLEQDRLYGRGSSDDGYAMFCALAAVETCRRAGGAHKRCIVVIEASEESGSPDLPAYLDALASRTARTSLVVGLDSESATYDRLWVTTSLRGVVLLDVTVEVLVEAV
ncbi:MAG: M20/M25/M40 family metallo-hydrolase, partial [Acidimicrobiales bacterium]